MAAVVLVGMVVEEGDEIEKKLGERGGLSGSPLVWFWPRTKGRQGWLGGYCERWLLEEEEKGSTIFGGWQRRVGGDGKMAALSW